MKQKGQVAEGEGKTCRKYRKRAMRKKSGIPFSAPKDCNVPDLGFHFNPEENYKIMLACKHAGEWMRDYGKGRQPYSIDLSHYHNNISDDNDPHII